MWDFFSNELQDEDFTKAKIAAVAVWDTVGSMGIPKYDLAENQLIDAFRFADINLSVSVDLGLHAIALDEQRLLLTPTLWNAAPNVKQMVFPGGHSDVGGGYIEKGLSDAALSWFIQYLQPLGVQFVDWNSLVNPRVDAPAHQEWRGLTARTKRVRKFKATDRISEHDSIQQRKVLKTVVHHKDEKADKNYDERPYRPTNWPLV